MQGQCLTPNIIYQADVSNNVDNEKKVYLGVSETLFKERLGNDIRDGKHERYSDVTELTKHESSNNNMENCKQSL